MIIERPADGYRVKVPCKINLFLEVLGRRSDGYHNLDTLMMAVSLVDELSISHREDRHLRLEIEYADGAGRPLDDQDRAWDIPADHQNLVIRALDRVRHSVGYPESGATVRLKKRIPALAGLGGGSADGAAAIVLGLLLWTSRIEFDQAALIASELGSDINFFLQGHSDPFWLARCTGRGEKIEVVSSSKTFHFVLVHPPRGCSTRDVFAALSPQMGNYVPHDPSTLIQALKLGDLEGIGKKFVNRLEQAAEKTNDWIGPTRSRIDRYDHHGQSLSGSGSARFCLCNSQEQAEKIAREINLQGEMRAFAVQSWQSSRLNEQLLAIQQGR
jgi:4-diphosphocytidyl-2-C-methyl-D-erythritol kinase